MTELNVEPFLAVLASAGKGGVRTRVVHGGNFSVGRDGGVRTQAVHGGTFSISREAGVRTRGMRGCSFRVGREEAGEDMGREWL